MKKILVCGFMISALFSYASTGVEKVEPKKTENNEAVIACKSVTKTVTTTNPNGSSTQTTTTTVTCDTAKELAAYHQAMGISAN